MKQVIQNPRSGKLEVADVPAPSCGPGQVLIANRHSVVSPGTEKMALDFARKTLLGKARSRPDLVRQVVRKLQQEGPLPTYRAVTTRLDSPQPLGYASAGVVLSAGEGVTRFAPGDRVACAGAGYANHAEIVAVPENLVVLVPEAVSLDRAAFSTLGAIAMQGLRVVEPQLGEIAAVIGLGMIGQLTVQLLRAAGCRVLAIDLDPARIEEAMQQGAEWGATADADHAAWQAAETEGGGVDFALVTAASDSSAPLTLAAELCRLKGRIGVIGATAMDLDRRSFYEKELDLRMSMSYGPGRYDRNYEELGLDYPISYVRWTENRNLQAFVALMASGAVDPMQLDVKGLPFAEAAESYERLARGERANLAVVFEYDTAPDASRALDLKAAANVGARAKKNDEVGVAFVGAGNYAKALLLPALAKESGLRRVSITTATGPSAKRTAESFDFARCGTDASEVLGDADVDLVFIATQHDNHAALAGDALRGGKAVWLEKPIGLEWAEVSEVLDAAASGGGLLAVGYNRRFSSHVTRIRQTFADRRGPMAVHYTVAAGLAPTGSWLLDPVVGGGRVIGECCHFIDTCIALVGATPTSVFARSLSRDREADDSTIALLGFADGSSVTLEYLANASTALSKERFEVSADGRTVTCDNYRTTHVAGGKSNKSVNQDKGQQAAVSAVVDAVRRGTESPFSLAELAATSATTFGMIESMRTGETFDVEALVAPYRSDD